MSSDGGGSVEVEEKSSIFAAIVEDVELQAHSAAAAIDLLCDLASPDPPSKGKKVTHPRH
jgi:hypothetical protein